MLRRAHALALAAVTALTATTTSSAADAAVASADAEVRIFYVYAPDDEIHFSIDAEGDPFSRPLPGLPDGLPTDARGTFAVTHDFTATGQTARVEGEVDCLLTGGGTASLTAVVTHATDDFADWIGHRVGVSLHDGDSDGRGDRLGFSWALAVDTVDVGGACLAPAPFAPVIAGDIDVRHAELPKGTGGAAALSRR
ncbi:hypothetical protein [Streptomyces sp. B6B3]|uniref:hypothetical protein n=1 Tax=Streptomyces sp. B6B3 TaxID=3153570 RepID=UPI00325E284F